MNSYKAFGLEVKSEIALPQFVPSHSQFCDVEIRLETIKHLFDADRPTDRAVQLNDSEITFFWDQIGWFLVRGGQEILVEPYPEVEPRLLSLPLIGIVFAALLQQRKMLVLHASAVSINDSGYIFVGWKGSGKSTTAAMLFERGHQMISDDIVAINMNSDGKLEVLPGFPIFKLMPETASSVFGDNPENLDIVCAGVEKRFRPATKNFLREPVPLKAIFSLQEECTLKTTLMPPQEALKILIANTYLARYGSELLRNKEAETNFRYCVKVMNSVPVYNLHRPKSFSVIDQYARLIETS